MYNKLRGDANTRNFHNYFYKDSSDDEFDFWIFLIYKVIILESDEEDDRKC